MLYLCTIQPNFFFWKYYSNLFNNILQVPVLCAMFLILFLGNTLTTIIVIPIKLHEKVKLQYRVMSQRLSTQLLSNREVTPYILLLHYFATFDIYLVPNDVYSIFTGNKHSLDISRDWKKLVHDKLIKKIVYNFFIFQSDENQESLVEKKDE